jgi:beta-glucosidase
MDMVGEGFLKTLKTSLQQGKVTRPILIWPAAACWKQNINWALFENPYKSLDAQKEKTEIMTDANRKSARVTAEHSFVLLKNANQILPLKKSGGSIAACWPAGR